MGKEGVEASTLEAAEEGYFLGVCEPCCTQDSVNRFCATVSLVAS